MVQIHGKGRYKIIASQLIMVLGVSVGMGVVSVVVHHILVSISDGGGNSVCISQGGGISDGLNDLRDGISSDRGGHLVSISDGGGVGVGSLSIVVLLLNGYNLGLGVDDGSIRGGITLRPVAISVVENLGISFSLSLGLSLVESVVYLGSIRISVVVNHRRGGHRVSISDGGGHLVVSISDGLDGLWGFVDHGVVDIGSLMGVDHGHLSLV